MGRREEKLQKLTLSLLLLDGPLLRRLLSWPDTGFPSVETLLVLAQSLL